MAKALDEPLLKAILTKMGADEASHGAFFYDILIKCHKGDLDALAPRLLAGTEQPGMHRLEWNGRASDGSRAPSGVYFLRVASGGRSETRRLIVLPSRAMAGIPIEALLAPGDTRTVSYARSATVFK